jgi:predicted permease
MAKWLTEFVAAGRRLKRTPSFTGLAVLTLALGIASAVAIFSVLYGVVLKPLPYDDSDQLVALWHSAERMDFSRLEMSNALFVNYRNAQSFDAIGIYDTGVMKMTGFEIPERVQVAEVSHDLLTTLRAVPVLGRSLTPADEQPGAPPVVLISYGFWEERFGGRPDAIGRTVTLDDRACEVVGVLPRGFAFPDGDVRLWTSVTFDPRTLWETQFAYGAIARLGPDASPESATAELTRILENVGSRPLVEDAGARIFATPFKQDVLGDTTGRLWMLVGMVTVVLVIACANVANLFLVRAEMRHREVALRTALGAARADLVRFFLAEAAWVGMSAGIIALACAVLVVEAFVATGPLSIPRLEEVAIDPVVVLYAGGITVLASLMFGIIPIVRHRSEGAGLVLKEGGRSATPSRRRHAIRHALVTGQVALAVILLIGAGLLLRSFRALQLVDPGVDTAEVQTVGIALSPRAYPDANASERFFRQLRERLSSGPDIQTVGMVSRLGFTFSPGGSGFWIEGVQYGDFPSVHDSRVASPGYFEAAGLSLLAGRPFETNDALNLTGAIVVSESFARQYWGVEEAIGKRLRSAQQGKETTEPWSTVVGVVEDARYNGVARDPVSTIYLAQVNHLGWDNQFMNLVVETNSLGSAELARRVRTEVTALDPNQPIGIVRTLDEMLADSMAREAFSALLLSVGAVIALLLGAVGIYGVMSFIFAERAPELSVRVALGARARDVGGMVLRQSVLVAGLGIGIGVAAALAGGGWLRSFLFGVGPRDPLVLVSVPLSLLVVALLASIRPAIRAMRADPAGAMRAE